MNTRSLDLPSFRARFRETGAGEPIVFVHGNSLHSAAFEDVMRSKALAGFRLVAPDLPGHGDSPPPANPSDYSLPGYARFLQELVSAMDLARAVWVGFSLGGHAILESPDRLNGAGIAIHGTPPFGSFQDFEMAVHPNEAAPILFKGEMESEEELLWARSLFRPGAVAAHVELVLAQLRATDPRARVLIGESLGRAEYEDEIVNAHNLKVPLAVFHGRKDLWIKPEYIEGLGLPLWRGGVQYIEESGHAPPIEQPEAYARLVADFAEDCTKVS